MTTILYIEDNLYNVQLVERLLLQRPTFNSSLRSRAVPVSTSRRPDTLISSFSTCTSPTSMASMSSSVSELMRRQPHPHRRSLSRRDARASPSVSVTPARTSTSPNRLDLKLLLALIDNYLGTPARRRTLNPRRSFRFNRCSDVPRNHRGPIFACDAVPSSKLGSFAIRQRSWQ